ncbi:PepSY-like domain-containing protein [Dysgonomonas sp. Marseille-P4677]|uniref:PepSY-like domain-containing protein n=1 Tax=Dysgonomonas sp. Marseille-P4677 TaxID=2364790 RepID=UPI001912D541|nr:PepSY-like domain-containing protein [Dysgonomonas sp. Marseille-P4677]MBK5721626.1 PepSY-like domain-containing protein [Dysgonomonas sp. Marseille-P4677]
MKKITTFLSIAIISLASCQLAVAQPSPLVSNKYSNAEIEKMINLYKSSHSRDIYPTELFRQQLMKDFPNARGADWETSANIYEVDFEIGRTDYKAYYDEQANLLMYIVEIRINELPAIVQNAAQAKYPNYKFEDMDKIVRGTDVLYEVEMEKGDIDVKAIFGENGTFVKEIFN